MASTGQFPWPSLGSPHGRQRVIPWPPMGSFSWPLTLRLTEFARLIEETDISVMRAASEVGWSDPRVASHWFHRRYGITPTQYRRTPHTVPDHRQGKAVAVNDSAL
ncbi:helix-turn-helix domain-containing protein [Micrococcus luteus]|uniref:helix-turn-helix domain-containing protein n=1 Tax=Micrococcus luteus TaxID=1270 RepID=UPI000D50517F|nr:helix-turn-helix domain-containing protein [Micrococcus luteus]